ncbi:sodium-dependent transporter [Thorsellia kenyensis]|uniref:Transporter n=1 Tax=Thorsellia kenyensis TaxID=1549888 RepID=A0ABV6C9M2_9GAMM
MRSQWGSKIGFILASAGSTIGLGAVWKFPFETSKNGGGAFLLIYLGICLTLGLVLMSTEIALGRKTQLNPYGAFKKLGGKGWSLIGLVGILVCFMIISFYSVIGGWTSAYFVSTLTGATHTTDGAISLNNFNTYVASPISPVMYHLFFACATAATILFGVQKGIEKVSKYLMPILLILLFILIIRSNTLPGSEEGLKQFLDFDFSKVTRETWISALGLSFFSLSLAMGIMITYGSYVDDKSSIIPSTVWIIVLTLTTCVLSGLMVLPAITALNLPANPGTGITFVTMPSVFASMPAGQLFGGLFFASLFVAALTSSISLLEVIVSSLIDQFKMKRITAVVISLVGFFSLGVLCSLSMGATDQLKILNLSLFDFLDVVTGQYLMPIGELFLALFVAWKVWPLIEEQLVANSPKLKSLMLPFRIFLGVVVPVIIILIFDIKGKMTLLVNAVCGTESVTGFCGVMQSLI